MRLLIAEDDAPMRSVLVRGLLHHGYALDVAERGDHGLELLLANRYAAAVVDWRMPGMSGRDMVATARRRGVTTPVLMLTARDTTADRVDGLDAGADDYLVKPFQFDELVARLRALLRRPPTSAEPVLRCGAVTFDPSTREAAVGGSPVALTPRELSILEVLLRRAPWVVTRAQIGSNAWQDEAEAASHNAIEVHIARLRGKLGGGRARIVAVRGTGYRILDE
ncbi:MAG: PhoB family transcriptional regulator [Chloroflexi bacterium]|jgi:two-component system response regulator QseB|nr:PhoB family transcriptional regulator [Chloroflexota bacterium]